MQHLAPNNIHTSNYIPYTKCMGTVNTVQKKTYCKLNRTCCNKLSFESLNQFLPHACTAKRWGSHFVAAAVVILGWGLRFSSEKTPGHATEQNGSRSLSSSTILHCLKFLKPRRIVRDANRWPVYWAWIRTFGLLNIHQPNHAHM